MEVNDLIFKELIKRGYSLEGKTRVWNIADSKLWYLTPDQAQAYLDLEDSKEYDKNVIQKELDLLEQNMDRIVKQVKGHAVNIVDLGCGDGSKAIIFINSLKEKGIKIRYCPIDISDYMVGKALDTVKRLNVGEVVECQWNISDFENLENIIGLLRRQKPGPNLFLLLGNTLGNFEINELMYEVRSSMHEGDVLVIGNGLDNRKIEDILKSYGTKEVDKFLGYIPNQLGLGKDDATLGVRFKNSRVELYYALKKKKTIKFQDKEVNFDIGDQIVVSVSYKYDKSDFKSFMNLYFDDVDVFISKDNSYAIALCKK